jgi:hypothetical protein
MQRRQAHPLSKPSRWMCQHTCVAHVANAAAACCLQLHCVSLASHAAPVLHILNLGQVYHSTRLHRLCRGGQQQRQHKQGVGPYVMLWPYGSGWRCQQGRYLDDSSSSSSSSSSTSKVWDPMSCYGHMAVVGVVNKADIWMTAAAAAAAAAAQARCGTLCHVMAIWQWLALSTRPIFG